MSFSVETGAGLADAESYVSVADADKFHLSRRNLAWLNPEAENDHKQAALIRATTYVDGAYRSRFPGYPLRGRSQNLQWPRAGAIVQGYFGNGWLTLPQDEIPKELKNAVCEAALRELTKPGSLSPDLKIGGEIKSVGAGSAQVTFAGGYTGQNAFQDIEIALGILLGPAAAFGGRIARM